MATKSKKKVIVEPEITRIGPEVPYVYSNHAEINTSINDVKIDFGTAMKDRNNKIVFENSATVFMSPQHAKKLVDILNQQLIKYELMFGELPKAPLPPPAPKKLNPPKSKRTKRALN